MTATQSFLASLAVVFSLTVFAGQKEESVSPPGPDGSLVIESGRPLDWAAAILSDRYGVPISCEDPKWLWSDDLLAGRWVVGDLPKFTLPGGLYPELTASPESAVQKAVEAYNRQNQQGLRFTVQKSATGLHIIPSQFHAAGGSLATPVALLDAAVSVPIDERTAQGHLTAICDQVSRARGIRLLGSGPFPGLDPYFAANGIIAPRDAETRPAEEKKLYSFAWGISNTNARDAIASLLEKSASTLRWFLRCDPVVAGEPRFCILNVGLLKQRITTEDGKLRPGKEELVYDRVATPPVPAPPRPPPE